MMFRRLFEIPEKTKAWLETVNWDALTKVVKLQNGRGSVYGTDVTVFWPKNPKP